MQQWFMSSIAELVWPHLGMERVLIQVVSLSMIITVILFLLPNSIIPLNILEATIPCGIALQNVLGYLLMLIFNLQM